MKVWDNIYFKASMNMYLLLCGICLQDFTHRNFLHRYESTMKWWDTKASGGQVPGLHFLQKTFALQHTVQTVMVRLCGRKSFPKSNNAWYKRNLKTYIVACSTISNLFHAKKSIISVCHCWPIYLNLWSFLCTILWSQWTRSVLFKFYCEFINHIPYFVSKLEQATFQSACKMWHDARNIRLTASTSK